MPVDSILEAARTGLNYERLRLDAASRNIAAANVPVAPGQTTSQWRVAGAPNDFGRLLGDAPALSKQQGQTRDVYEPGHPMADRNGYVRYTSVDMVQEMTTLLTASRGYEANVRSFNLLRGMLLRALEIGAK